MFFTTVDEQTARSMPRPSWKSGRYVPTDYTKGETMTMAPLVVKGKVLVGNSGREFGVRGWMTALDEKDEKILWRAYSTGPDRDVLIEPEYKPFMTWTRVGISSDARRRRRHKPANIDRHGRRQAEWPLRDRLNAALARRQAEIARILADYQVPQEP